MINANTLLKGLQRLQDRLDVLESNSTFLGQTILSSKYTDMNLTPGEYADLRQDLIKKEMAEEKEALAPLMPELWELEYEHKNIIIQRKEISDKVKVLSHPPPYRFEDIYELRDREYELKQIVKEERKLESKIQDVKHKHRLIEMEIQRKYKKDMDELWKLSH